MSNRTQQNNLYRIGKGILTAGLQVGELMSRAEQVHDRSTDIEVKSRAVALYNQLNNGTVSVERAQEVLDTLEAKTGT